MLATPRGITQPHTSFIGSACQGIHHTPVTKHTDTQTNRYKHQNTKKKDTRVHYTVLKQHNTQNNTITTIGNHITSRRSHKEQNRLSQTPNSHDKPKTSLTQPHKQCQPQHTHTLKQTMRHDPTTNNHTHVAEPVTYSPRNKNKQKYSLERR